MVAIDLEAVNLAKWKQTALEVEKALNGRQLMMKTSSVLKKRFKLLAKEAFLTTGFSTGKIWKPLNRKYAAQKTLRFPEKDILRRKDDLFKSYTRKPVSLFFKSTGGYSYEYGSKDFKAAWHQKGTSTMPARKVIKYTAQQLNGIAAAIRRTTLEVIKARKFFDRVPSARIAIQNNGFDRVDIP